MGIRLEKILKHIGETKEEFAESLKKEEKIEISVEDLEMYENGTKQPTLEIVESIIRYTGMKRDEIMGESSESDYLKHKIEPQNMWEPTEEAKNDIEKYIQEGYKIFDDDFVEKEIKSFEMYLEQVRKPRVIFAGKSDSGKSTLINSLLGEGITPVNWTATTSIIIYLKHIEEKPVFSEDNVLIFKKKNDKYFDENRLKDENYFNEYLLSKGNYDLLEKYGTHQGNNKEAASAIVFVDSPLLKDCTIVDIPGFAVNKNDDMLHKTIVDMYKNDCLVYLSSANHFLHSDDLIYLNKCMKTITHFENKDKNNFPKFGNLFIVASQAGQINDGDIESINNIIDKRSDVLCDMFLDNEDIKYCDTPYIFQALTNYTGYTYTRDDIKSRFYTFEKDLPRLCKKFRKDFSESIVKLTELFYEKVCEGVELKKQASLKFISKYYDKYNGLLSERVKYLEILKGYLNTEPQRKVKHDVGVREVSELIKKLGKSAQKEFEKYYIELMTEESLVKKLKIGNYKNTDDDKTKFLNSIDERIQRRLEYIIGEKRNQIDSQIKELEIFSYEYESDNYVSDEMDKNNKLEKDIYGKAIDGVANVVELAAAWGIGNGLIGLAELIGMIGIGGIGGIAVLGIPVVFHGAIIVAIKFIREKLNQINWEERFAKAIIKQYDTVSEKGVVSIYIESIGKYFDELGNAFEKLSEIAEKKHSDMLKEYERLADEKNMPQLRKKVEQLKTGTAFFSDLPLPKKA